MNRSTRILAAVAALLSIPLLPGTALAEAPMVKTQAPGWHRTMVGDFEVTALFDGAGKLPMLKLLVNAPPAQIASALKRGFLGEVVETSINAYLINTGSRLVLIDTGTGGTFGYPAALPDNLRAAGYKPEQVDEVYITHAHPDHVAGLMAGGAPLFPGRIDLTRWEIRHSDQDLVFELRAGHARNRLGCQFGRSAGSGQR